MFKVLYYRHKLQRGFLSRDTVPKAEEMKSMSDFLSELETYPDLEGSIIRVTKIHKVLKQMIKLDAIPLEEEFNFKDRSGKLLAKWNETLASDGTADDKTDEKAEDKAEDKTAPSKSGDRSPTEDKAPTTNGQKEGEQVEDQKAEAEEASAPEVPESMLENKLGTTVEGDKEADPQAVTNEEEQQEEKTAGEKQTDGPAIETAPAEEYKPPPEEGAMDTTA